MESDPSAPPVNEVDPGDFRYGIRPGTPEDIDFVVDSWRRSYDDSPWARCPGGLREYIATQRQVILQCLKTSQVLVAYPEAPERVESQIMGWLCHRMPVVHYLYVKAPFRRHGIGRALLQHAAMATGSMVGLHATHLLPPRHRVGWFGELHITYNPALIFGGDQ